MHSFSLDQRYTSEAEPELGVGIVTELTKGRVKIDFPACKETRLYAAETAPLRRVRFKIGDTIVDGTGRSLVIDQVQEGDDLIQYFGGGRMISEAQLGQVTVRHGADDRLQSGDVDAPALFSLRRRSLQHDHARRISAVHGFLGGRIDLIPHQLYIAHEVSARFAPRVLLSDEVGLGKTIEACLIVHRLVMQGRIARVLILVPDSLVHQWFVELLRRFNMWFHIFDEPRCRSAEPGAPGGNPFLDDQFILCSTSFLAGSPKRAEQARAAGWDMLVVDEAHHLEWSVNKASAAYKMVESLSQSAAGLLLLTATPEQLGVESHFARLRLLDPVRYVDFVAFQKEAADHRFTANLVGKLANKESLSPAESTLLAALVGDARVQALATGEDAARETLVQDLLDQHGPGRVIFRNRRVAMTGFPRRVVHLSPILPELAVVESATEEVPSSSLQETDHQLEWLIALMQKLRPAKVLLICNSKAKVLALEEALRTRVKFKMGVFHEDLTLIQRDRNAAYFAEENGARLLLCSELGSEGRNFQFAHHLILFDLPLHPDLLEQRIGRLDRIGQTADIQIHIPFLVGSADEALAKWYHEGLNAFAQNLEGGNRMWELFGERLQQCLADMPSESAESALAGLIAETRTLHGELKETLAAGRDRLLEMNSFRPEVAATWVDEIRAADQDTTLEAYLMGVFEHYGIDVEDLAPRTYLLNPMQRNVGAFPGLPDEGMGVTFDRKRALSREEIGFLTWDHPLVTGALDLVLSAQTGNASFGVMRTSDRPVMLLEAIFVVESSGAQSRSADRFFPKTPIRIVVDHTGENVTAQYPADAVDQQIRAGNVDDLLANELLIEGLFPNMLAAAAEIAEIKAKTEISLGLRRMQFAIDHEIDRLQALQTKNNNIRPEEIALAQAERNQLGQWIREASVRLDAVQLIQVGSF